MENSVNSKQQMMIVTAYFHTCVAITLLAFALLVHGITEPATWIAGMNVMAQLHLGSYLICRARGKDAYFGPLRAKAGTSEPFALLDWVVLVGGSFPNIAMIVALNSR
jgi:hypothetical protein